VTGLLDANKGRLAGNQTAGETGMTLSTSILPDTAVSAAAELAAAGWKVFPCWPAGDKAKSPLTKRGHLEATRDPNRIRKWWTRWPTAMIGGVVPTHLVVLDLDPRHGGTRDALEQLADPMPITLAVWSGRDDGGCHLYFQRPLGPLTSTRLPAGVDLKVGGKGYCIMPPSNHPATGKAYRWGRQREPAILPQRLQELLVPAKPIDSPSKTNTSANGRGLIRKVATTEKGNRDRVLFWAACRAAEDGILDEIQDQLVAASVSTGFPETQAWNKIASARKTIT
jgi:hypothetical protein